MEQIEQELKGDNILELIAEQLGFHADKYYSAAEQMDKCHGRGSGAMSTVM